VPAQVELAEEAIILAARTDLGEAAVRAGTRLAQDGLDLFEQTPAKIQVKSAEGIIEGVSPAEFEHRFGVKYLPKLVIDESCPFDPLAKLPGTSGWSPPPESGRAAFEHDFARSLPNSFPTSQHYGDGERKAWLYADQIRHGQTANMYIAKVNDVVGHGVFAGEDIAPGKMLGEYTGLARSYRGGHIENENAYLFRYGSKGATLDAREMGNITRFINHSGDHPNAKEAEVIVDDVQHMVLIATRSIAKDTQILFDYGEDYWAERTPLDLGKGS
jgi:SET domain